MRFLTCLNLSLELIYLFYQKIWLLRVLYLLAFNIIVFNKNVLDFIFLLIPYKYNLKTIQF